MQRAFTLIELLVVVTIIVVLLALLAPALSKAIYQAQLTSCGAGNVKVMASAVTLYAMENKRYYPDRDMADRQAKETGKLPISPFTIRRPLADLDIRPLHRTIFPINKTLQCPLSPHVELENYDVAEQDIALDASYVMFWSWQYKSQDTTYKGMFKVGDRFTYHDLLAPDPANTLVSFNVLAGDEDLAWGAGGGAYASHPDREPQLMALQIVDGDMVFGERLKVGRWGNVGNLQRGLLDLNFAFADGSVGRYDGVTRVDLNRDNPQRDDRMARVPINFDNFNNRGENVDKMHLPRR